MSYVVSANYRDRSSAYRWLVRKADEPIGKAVAYKTIKATGVTFGGSNGDEQGFGCRVVAFAESVEAGGREPGPKIEIVFNGHYDFENRSTGARVTKKTFASLELTETGKIFGEIAPEPVENEHDAE